MVLSFTVAARVVLVGGGARDAHREGGHQVDDGLERVEAERDGPGEAPRDALQEKHHNPGGEAPASESFSGVEGGHAR